MYHQQFHLSTSLQSNKNQQRFESWIKEKRTLGWRWDVWLKPQLLDCGEPRAQEWRQRASDGSSMDSARSRTCKTHQRHRHQGTAVGMQNSRETADLSSEYLNKNLHWKQWKKGNIWRWNHVSWTMNKKKKSTIFQYYFKNNTIYCIY